MELVSFKGAPKEFKVRLLKELGFDLDERGVYVMQNGQKVLDKYIDKPIRLENMIIFPGSTIILDDNPLSIASYMEEYGEVP